MTKLSNLTHILKLWWHNYVSCPLRISPVLTISRSGSACDTICITSMCTAFPNLVTIIANNCVAHAKTVGDRIIQLNLRWSPKWQCHLPKLSGRHLNRATHLLHPITCATQHCHIYRIQCDALESCCKFQVRTGKHCNMYSGLQYKYKLISNTNLLNLSIFFFWMANKWALSGHSVPARRPLAIVTRYRLSILIVYEDPLLDYLWQIAVGFTIENIFRLL